MCELCHGNDYVTLPSVARGEETFTVNCPVCCSDEGEVDERLGLFEFQLALLEALDQMKGRPNVAD